MKKFFLLLFATLLVVPVAGAQDTFSSSDTVSAQSGTISTTTQRRHHRKHRNHHHNIVNAQSPRLCPTPCRPLRAAWCFYWLAERWLGEVLREVSWRSRSRACVASTERG